MNHGDRQGCQHIGRTHHEAASQKCCSCPAVLNSQRGSHITDQGVKDQVFMYHDPRENADNKNGKDKDSDFKENADEHPAESEGNTVVQRRGFYHFKIRRKCLGHPVERFDQSHGSENDDTYKREFLKIICNRLLELVDIDKENGQENRVKSE